MYAIAFFIIALSFGLATDEIPNEYEVKYEYIWDESDLTYVWNKI